MTILTMDLWTNTSLKRKIKKILKGHLEHEGSVEVKLNQIETVELEGNEVGTDDHLEQFIK